MQDDELNNLKTEKVTRKISAEDCLRKVRRCKDEVVSRFIDRDAPWRIYCRRNVTGSFGSTSLTLSVVDFGSEFWLRSEANVCLTPEEVAFAICNVNPSGRKAWFYSDDFERTIEIIKKEDPLLRLDQHIHCRWKPKAILDFFVLTGHYKEPDGSNIVIRVSIDVENNLELSHRQHTNKGSLDAFHTLARRNMTGGTTVTRLAKLSMHVNPIPLVLERRTSSLDVHVMLESFKCTETKFAYSMWSMTFKELLSFTSQPEFPEDAAVDELVRKTEVLLLNTPRTSSLPGVPEKTADSSPPLLIPLDLQSPSTLMIFDKVTDTEDRNKDSHFMKPPSKSTDIAQGDWTSPIVEFPPIDKFTSTHNAGASAAKSTMRSVTARRQRNGIKGFFSSIASISLRLRLGAAPQAVTESVSPYDGPDHDGPSQNRPTIRSKTVRRQG
mmetsp:Transcript_40002/g.64901  ORF Transcript_40002/g.64901 Transcript_40002/m.64901 type:complete len:439 (-) Transcript_40002:169-1485(-)